MRFRRHHQVGQRRTRLCPVQMQDVRAHLHRNKPFPVRRPPHCDQPLARIHLRPVRFHEPEQNIGKHENIGNHGEILACEDIPCPGGKGSPTRSFGAESSSTNITFRGRRRICAATAEETESEGSPMTSSASQRLWTPLATYPPNTSATESRTGMRSCTDTDAIFRPDRR